jgi:hypothetical protein
MSAANGETLVSAINRLLLRLDARGVSANEIVACMKPLIADSEARAVAAAVTALTCTHHNDAMRAACPVCLVAALTAERNQLRAALALGQINCDAEYDDLRDERDAARARAERAEAELASERGRLDYLSTRGFEHRHHETGDHLGYEWTISSYSESEDVTLRDVIDAEMREDEK